MAQCAGDQVCGSDGFCASPAVAGHCTGVDASTFVSLRIAIEGHGKISIEQIGDCDSDTATEGNCTFTVPPMVARDLKAVENLDHKFLEWTQTCVGTITTCSLTPVMELTQVGAKFE